MTAPNQTPPAAKPPTTTPPARPTRPPARPRRGRRRAGFFFVYGWRTITTREFTAAVRGTCPHCNVADARLVGLVRRPWFTLMFIQVFPIQRAAQAQRLSQCRQCRHTFDWPLEQLARRAGAISHSTLADTFAVYNDFREHPHDGARLLRLLRMYEAAGEPAEPESAARHFPHALAAEPACAAVLDRLRRGS